MRAAFTAVFALDAKLGQKAMALLGRYASPGRLRRGTDAHNCNQYHHCREQASHCNRDHRFLPLI
jgi:hypothetical protein